jgi:GTP-binding protein HflX
MIEITHITETAVLVGLITFRQDEARVHETLDELEFLFETAGGTAVKRFIQKLEKPDTRTFVGSGKLEEIKAFITVENVGTVVFDDELSPSQLRNIEKELQCKVLDRTTLILDIFARRARTATARTQVELAQYQYLLPTFHGCGRISKSNAEVSACAARVKRKLKPTAVSSATASAC